MNIGFKEWALVCQALESGQTSLILRKGGIAEGRAGFRFRHADFFLFPTFFHEQVAKTSLPPGSIVPAGAPGVITIDIAATVEWTELVTDPALLEKLTPFHILQENVIRERFQYDEKPGLHVAFLRVRKLAEPWVFANDPKYGGCRSWVDLSDRPTPAAENVLSVAEHASRSRQLRDLLKPA